jgi:hypothetical protein
MPRGQKACSHCRASRCKCVKTKTGCKRCEQHGLPCEFSRPLALSDTPTNAFTPSQASAPRAANGSESNAQLMSGETRLVVGIDFGTQSTSICWQIVPQDLVLNAETLLNPIYVEVENSFRIPTVAAIVRDRDKGTAGMAYGSHVKHCLKTHEPSEIDVLHLLKLGLVRVNDGDLEREHAIEIDKVHAAHREILDRTPRPIVNASPESSPPNTITIEHVLEGFFTYLNRVLKQHISSKIGLELDIISDLLIEGEICVAFAPDWLDDWIDQFLGCVSRAGFPKAHVVSEPKCAAAVMAAKRVRFIKESTPVDRRAETIEHLMNTNMVVVDIGHGTAVSLIQLPE